MAPSRVPSLNATFGFIIHCISTFPRDRPLLLQTSRGVPLNSWWTPTKWDNGIYQMSPPSGSCCFYSFQFVALHWRETRRLAPWSCQDYNSALAESSHNLRNSSTLFYFLNECSSQFIYIILPKVEWKDWSLGSIMSLKHFVSRK